MKWSFAPYQVVRIYHEPDRILEDDGTETFETENVLNSFLTYESAVLYALHSTERSYWSHGKSHIEIRHRGKVVARFDHVGEEDESQAFVFKELD